METAEELAAPCLSELEVASGEDTAVSFFGSVLEREDTATEEKHLVVVPIPSVSGAVLEPLLQESEQDVDPISSKSTSVSEVEEGQILESSSDGAESLRASKRPCSVLSDGGLESVAAKKVKKRISFSDVTAYYFPRAQGFTCVPSQGGSTLGMALKHSHEESFSLSEHASQQRRNHRRLLLQLRKRRKNRSRHKDAEEETTPEPRNEQITTTAAGSSEETKEIINEFNRESESDDSDTGQQISDISDSELDVDNYYFLQPVPTKQRRALLRESGVGKIETSEKDDCKQIRVSRESCGCSCQVYCEPESCSCAQSGIQCQVDRLNFPCGCSRDACANPSGRVEFNPVRVRTHFIHTLMRLELENAADQQQASGSSTKNLLQLHQPLQAIDESLPADVSDSGVGSVQCQADGTYQWENVIPALAPTPHAGYPLVTDPLTENGWFSHYNESSNPAYSLYSGVVPGGSSDASATTEVFSSYDPAPYVDSLMYQPVGATEPQSAEPSSSTQYTELDSGQSYYQDYGVQSYTTPFDHNGFSASYPNEEAYRSGVTEDAYGYAVDGGQSFVLDSSTAESSDVLNSHPDTSAPNKAAESSSSSEEDALDMSSSLATIVKETMVSV